MSENNSEKKYHAFISYRHADNKIRGREWATWLHQAIETYQVPDEIVGRKNDRGEIIPSRIFPIFRDEEELPADADLGRSIIKALDDTRLLIVLCSPNAATSTYVADEIDYFKKQGHSDRIIAAMIDGEPNASWDKSKQENGFTVDDECFPVPLQFKYDQEGNRTDKRAEPIAADFRVNEGGKPKQGWTTSSAFRQYLQEQNNLDTSDINQRVEEYHQQQHLMLLKIIAGILGIPLGDLTERDKEYQLEQERAKAKTLRKWLSAVAALAILAIGGGIIAWFQTEKATEQQEIAEVQTEIAKGERDTALMNESNFLMDQAKQANDDGASDVAMLLALNALPGPYGGDRPLLNDLSELRRALSGEKKSIVFQHGDLADSVTDKMLWKMKVSPNGEILATTTTKSIVLWQLNSGEKLREFSIARENIFSGPYDLIFSRDSNYVLASLPGPGASNPEIMVWSVNTGENVYKVKNSQRNLSIVLGEDDKILTVNDDVSGEYAWLSLKSGEMKPFFDLGDLKNISQRFYSSKNGNAIASTELRRKDIIRMWSQKTGMIESEIISAEELGDLYLDPTGEAILSVSIVQKSALLFSVGSGETIGKYDIEASGQIPKFSENGKLLLLPVSMSNAEMISVQTGEILHTIDGGGFFLGATFSPKNDIVFVKTAMAYQIIAAETGELLSTLNSQEEIGETAFSSDGQTLILSDLNGAASLWPLNQQSLNTDNAEDLVKLAIDNLPINRTCLTPDERTQYSLRDLTDEQWKARGCPQFTQENR